MGYPIEYIRQYRYYNAWDYKEFRDDFGLFWENGVLKRKPGKTDHESQDVRRGYFYWGQCRGLPISLQVSLQVSGSGIDYELSMT